MKYILSIVSLLVSQNLLAAEGFTWLGGLSEQLNLPTHILHFGLIAILFLILSVAYRVKTPSISAAIIPDKGISYRNIMEALAGFMYNLCKNIMGEKKAKEYFGIIMLLFTFIFLSNLIGLIPGFLPPTDNLNTTLALGILVFIYYNVQGIRTQGLVNHVKHFMGPVWYLAFLIMPIELISHAVRPLSLGLRLKGNMEGDHLVLSIFSDLIPYVIPIPFYVLGMFVCFIQAFVFVLLTMVYINLATETHDQEEQTA